LWIRSFDVLDVPPMVAETASCKISYGTPVARTLSRARIRQFNSRASDFQFRCGGCLYGARDSKAAGQRAYAKRHLGRRERCEFSISFWHAYWWDGLGWCSMRSLEFQLPHKSRITALALFKSCDCYCISSILCHCNTRRFHDRTL
jgi:hypothetical protein